MIHEQNENINKNKLIIYKKLNRNRNPKYMIAELKNSLEGCKTKFEQIK